MGSGAEGNAVEEQGRVEGQGVEGQGVEGQGVEGQGVEEQRVKEQRVEEQRVKGQRVQEQTGKQGLSQQRTRKKRRKKLHGPIAYARDGVMDSLERLQGWRHDGGPGIEYSENAVKRSKDKDSKCKEQIGYLLDLGNKLDRITPEERWYRDERTGDVIWAPTWRDNWIEEHLKIRTKAGTIVPFKLNAAQREYSRVALERGAKKNIVLKARQLGMTTYIAARLFVQTISHEGMLTMLVAHNRDAAEEIFRIVHRFWNNLADELRTGALKTSHSSARELVFPALDSEFTVTSADDNAGRGRTIQNLHCTEVSRWGNDAEEALVSLRAALVPQGEIVLESTANGAWGQFYQEWQQADETGYVRHFFPWWFEESYVSDVGPGFELTEDEKALADLHELSNRQIAWRRSQWAAMRGLAKQEFAEDATTCFKATGECAFELDSIEEALLKAVPPVATEDNHALLTWLPPQPGREYVIGVDPAGGGVDGDYSCAEVIDREWGMQCAELHGHFNPMELAKKVADLGNRYNLAQVAVESNNHGGSVLADLNNLGYLNIYRGEYGEGWLTSAKSRPPMIENLGWALLRDAGLFRSERFLNECRTFVRQKNGIPAAAQGSHDDCVMAMAIGWAVRAEGKKEKNDCRSQKSD